MGKSIELLKILLKLEKRWRLLLVIVCSFLISFIQIYVGNLARKTIDEKLLEYNMASVFISFLLIIIFGTLITYILNITRSSLSIDTDLYLKKVMLDKFDNLHMSYFVTGHTGKMENRLFRDIEQLSEYFSTTLPEITQNIIIFTVAFTYMVYLNPLMTIIVVTSIPLTILFTNKIINPIFNSMTNYVNKIDEAMVVAKETISGMDIIKAYNLEEASKNKFKFIIDQAVNHFVSYEKYVAMSSPIKYIIKSLPTFIYIVFALVQMKRGIVSGGEFIAFTYLLRIVSKPLSTFPTFIINQVQILVNFDKYQEILTYEDEREGSLKINQESEKIFEFKDVSFRYPNGKKALNRINLTIEKGKKVAFVGPSGCGKTTMFRLMTGQYMLTEGELKFKGLDLLKIDLHNLRENISYISQDNYLFPVSVFENINYGKLKAEKCEVISAAKAAYAHDFILKLPAGYNTVLSEGAVNISGGQKQRLSIARGLLKNAPVFMLDEMTSALDYESEEYVQQSIDKLGSDKTVIIIAHRLSTVVNADEILVFNEGEIVERGNHETLLKEKGLYHQLFETQNCEGE